MSKKLKFFAMVLTCILLSINQVWADYSYTFTEKVFSANGTNVATTLGTVSWNYTSSQSVTSGKDPYWGYDATKGQQWGSKNAQASVTLSTTGISGTITSVTVNASVANDGSGTLSVSVGGTDYKSGNNTSVSLTTTATAYTFTSTSSSSGTIVITLNSSTKKGIYMKSISVVASSGSSYTLV